MTIRSTQAASFSILEPSVSKAMLKSQSQSSPNTSISSITTSQDTIEAFEEILKTRYEPIIHRLLNWLVDSNLLSDMKASFDKILSHNIQEISNFGIKTLKDFFNYMNQMLHWIPQENYSGQDIYHRLVTFWLIFNEAPLGHQQNTIHPSSHPHKLTWLSQWLIDFSLEIGSFHDTPESITEASLQTFYDSPIYKMHHYIQPRGGWKTFNQFFARNFKPGYRTIAGLTDSTVIVSPADCTYAGSWPVDTNSLVTVKHLTWSITELLNGSIYADAFRGGIFTHSFLNTFDYHRIHSPVSGKVLEACVIQGQAYFETHTQYLHQGHRDSNGTPVPTCKAYAPNSPGYQFVQMRGLIVLDTPVGLVAILPVGMAAVSSVVMTAEEGVVLRKGEEMAYFQFGGSDVVMVFQERSRVHLTAVEETHYNMGFQVGTATVQ